MELDQPIRVGEALVLAGYGLTSVTGIDRSGTLRRVTTAITALSSTRKEIEFGNNPGRSACMGDSGGPAFVIRAGILRLVGVTSRGSPQCDQDGIYTDARYFKPFIDAAI
jgi:secreted trypsin-like serine protease